MGELEQKVINQLLEELVGEDKVYPVEKALYDFDYETTEVKYKPEVFEKYVEIYNSLSNE